MKFVLIFFLVILNDCSIGPEQELMTDYYKATFQSNRTNRYLDLFLLEKVWLKAKEQGKSNKWFDEKFDDTVYFAAVRTELHLGNKPFVWFRRALQNMKKKDTLYSLLASRVMNCILPNEEQNNEKFLSRFRCLVKLEVSLAKKGTFSIALNLFEQNANQQNSLWFEEMKTYAQYSEQGLRLYLSEMDKGKKICEIPISEEFENWKNKIQNN